MRLTVVNATTCIDPSEFQKVVRAIARQVSADFQPEWGVSATLVGVSDTQGERLSSIQGSREAIIYVCESADDARLGSQQGRGFHAKTHEGVPFGFVYLDVCCHYGEHWSCTLSHEVLELIADPTVSLLVKGPVPKQDQVQSKVPVKEYVYYDLEVCDPTQGDSYLIDGVQVSNFVCRHFFGLAGGSGKTNFLDLELEPFGVRPGGYLQYEVDGGVFQVSGSSVSSAMREAKKRMGATRRVARRSEMKMAKGPGSGGGIGGSN